MRDSFHITSLNPDPLATLHYFSCLHQSLLDLDGMVPYGSESALDFLKEIKMKYVILA